MRFSLLLTTSFVVAVFSFSPNTHTTIQGFQPRSLPNLTNLTYTITHISITSKYSFNATRTFLEAAIPSIDLTPYRTAVAAGNYTAARAALDALPPLNNFASSESDFGLLNTVYGVPTQAVLYEIGNPVIAVRMMAQVLRTGIYAPVRVFLIEDRQSGQVTIEFDAPTTTFGGLGGDEVLGVASELQQDLETALGKVAA